MGFVHKIRIGPLIPSKLGKTIYNMSGFNKYGLYRDDCFNELDPNVIEAIRRLPRDLYDGRVYRIVRALDLGMKHRILPKEEWTTYECDVKYLEPYLNEVIEEKKEKKIFLMN